MTKPEQLEFHFSLAPLSTALDRIEALRDALRVIADAGGDPNHALPFIHAIALLAISRDDASRVLAGS